VNKRFQTFVHSVFFVLGFTLIFVALGATATALGQLLLGARLWIQRIGGVVVIILGLHVMGVITIPLLYSEKRMHVQTNPRLGYLSSFLVGLFFAAGWTPCLGPVLATMLTWAASSTDLWQGVLMLTFYSLGFGIPFLLTGLLFDAATTFLRRLNRHMRVISIVSGVLLIGIGLLMLTDSMTRVAGLFGAFSLESELGQASLTIPIAVLAGLLSFVSPCVLPLVPAYLGYLGGTSVSSPVPKAAG
jgi:cytochrome c-type biogenesis protein